MIILLNDRHKTRIQANTLSLYRISSVITRQPDVEHPSIELCVGNATLKIVYHSEEERNKDMESLDKLLSMEKI